MKKKIKWPTLILLTIFFIGLCVMLYPSISKYWNSKTQSKAIIDYDKMLAAIPKEDFQSFFDAADKYNNELRALDFPLLDYEQVKGYNDSLDVIGTGMMGYITIDKIAVELPVYHGTEEEVLSAAVGHIEGTSLPTGGKGNHTVLSAHRGLPTATLFTNLDHLELGDTFKLTILDRVITYRVDQIKTVTPDNSEDLVIDKDKDYCTLLTCTPYGINTHRLIVRGVRTETVEDKIINIVNEGYRIDTLIVTPIVALPIIFVLILIVLFKPVKKEKDGDDLF
ncbi:MAG: class C sortase [Ruminococcaceae bacterium]|nr:class C sortase [Oscillospiraceae bacterium]